MIKKIILFFFVLLVLVSALSGLLFYDRFSQSSSEEVQSCLNYKTIKENALIKENEDIPRYITGLVFTSDNLLFSESGNSVLWNEYYFGYSGFLKEMLEQNMLDDGYHPFDDKNPSTESKFYSGYFRFMDRRYPCIPVKIDICGSICPDLMIQEIEFLSGRVYQ